MRILKKTKFQKGDTLVKKYKFCGLSVLRKEKSLTKQKYKFLGIKISKKNKYTEIGKKNKYTEISIDKYSDIYITDLINYYSTLPKKFISNNVNSATIIIPVYNGLEHLLKLIPSLQLHTPKNVKIIIIDDCSPDEKIQSYLKQIKEYENIIIYRNNKNLGFVGSINVGMQLVTTRFAVWLNSDTVVPEYWLERLLAPFNKYDKIATTTPFTNSGCGFSFPNFGENNKLIKPLEYVDKIFQKINTFDVKLNTTYSGTGFCMAIDMNCWREIGKLDEKNFGKGYGEENDWCFRALQRGWKHMLVPNLFIQHCHGGTFLSEEKAKLTQEHLNILKQKYPNEMNEIVPCFFKQDPWKKYRALVSILCCKNKPVIIIDLKKQTSDQSGAISYSEKMIESLIKDGYDVIVLQYERSRDNIWELVPISICNTMRIKLKYFSEINILFSMINIEKVIVNNFAYLINPQKAIDILYELKQKYPFSIEYKFHDYLSICPAFFLINFLGKNCLSFDRSSECSICLHKSTFKTIAEDNIFTWRNMWNKFFSVVDEFSFFSEYTLNKVKKVYPIVLNKYNIREHQPLFSEEFTKYTRPAKNAPLKIAFVGVFCYEKGSKYFIELQGIFEKQNIAAEFVIIGVDNPHIKHKNIHFISGYNRDILGKILTENNVHLAIYSSINNETFSYVAQELMLLNVPFVTFDNGAHAERIRKYQYPLAKIAENVSGKALFEATRSILNEVYSIKI